MPTHSQHTVSLVSISLAHINTALPLVLSLCCLSSPLTRPPPLAAASFLVFFCSAVSVLLAFFVSKSCQLSPLSSGRWLSVPCVHPRCPSCSCCLFSVFLILSVILTLLFFFFFFSCHFPSSTVHGFFFFLLFCSVLSFIHSSHLVSYSASQDPHTMKGLERGCTFVNSGDCRR